MIMIIMITISKALIIINVFEENSKISDNHYEYNIHHNTIMRYTIIVLLIIMTSIIIKMKKIALSTLLSLLLLLFFVTVERICDQFDCINLQKKLKVNDKVYVWTVNEFTQVNKIGRKLILTIIILIPIHSLFSKHTYTHTSIQQVLNNNTNNELRCLYKSLSVCW